MAETQDESIWNEHITCLDCGELAPNTETAYTLIGQRYGWRLTFRKDGDGKQIQEWRCNQCFKRAKGPRLEP